MSMEKYVKQTFQDGTVLHAADLNQIGTNIEEVKKATSLPIEKDIQITVGATGQFSNLGQAIAYASNYRPVYVASGAKCEIKILSGTVIADQVIVSRMDLQYIVITSEDAEVQVDSSTWTTGGLNEHDLRGDVPFFGGENAASLPTIGTLFSLAKTGTKPTVAYFCNRGSKGIILPGSGFKNFSDGAIANNESSITLREGICSNMKRWGVHARHNGEISARSADLSKCNDWAAYADRIADIDIREATLTGSDKAIYSNNCSRINANGAHSYYNQGSNTYGLVRSASGSLVNADKIDIQFCNHGNIYTLENGGTIIANGGFVSGVESPYKVYCQPVNIMTVNGVIYGDSEITQIVDDSKVTADTTHSSIYSNQVYANSLRRTVSGPSIKITDISPLEHEVTCTVSGTSSLAGVIVTALPSGRTYSTDGSGKVLHLLSEYPDLELKTNVPEAQLTVTYSQDINKVPIGEFAAIGNQVKENSQKIASLEQKTEAQDMKITGALVGQMVEIAAVDSKGVPTKWRAVTPNFSGGPVQPGTGSESIGYIDDNNSIILNGLKTGTYSLDFGRGTKKIEKAVSPDNYTIGNFLLENSLPVDSKGIQVFDVLQGKQVGIISTKKDNSLVLGKKLYNFAAYSDIHIPEPTSQEDFNRALTFAETNNCSFVCISGDLTDHGKDEEFTEYRNIVAAHTIPVHAVGGNHEIFNRMYDPVYEMIERTNEPLYYSFKQDEDLFIMLGLRRNIRGHRFAPGELQWLYDLLESNRDRRIFIFEHMFLPMGSGNALGLYKYETLDGLELQALTELFSHYQNIIFCHGHSHMRFHMQEEDRRSTYSNNFNIHDVHIPSVTKPRESPLPGSRKPYETMFEESEGYLIQVYENGIVFNGVDLITGEFLPIGTYTLMTDKKYVPANTFIDVTGQIRTSLLDTHNRVTSKKWNREGKIDTTTGQIISTSSNYAYTDFFEKGEINEIVWAAEKSVKLYLFVYDDMDQLACRRIVLSTEKGLGGVYYVSPGQKIRLQIKASSSKSLTDTEIENFVKYYKDPRVEYVPVTFTSGRLDESGDGTIVPGSQDGDYWSSSLIEIKDGSVLYSQWINEVACNGRKLYYDKNTDQFTGNFDLIKSEYKPVAVVDDTFYQMHETHNMKIKIWCPKDHYNFKTEMEKGINVFRVKDQL